MNQEQVLSHFRDTDALLEGHFVLSSGLHSNTYLQFDSRLHYLADSLSESSPFMCFAMDSQVSILRRWRGSRKHKTRVGSEGPMVQPK